MPIPKPIAIRSVSPRNELLSLLFFWNLAWTFVLTLVLLGPVAEARGALAAEGESNLLREPRTLLGRAVPYAPRSTDYSLETGLMSSKDDLFWMSALIGAHLGQCPLAATDTCQLYLDGLIGAALREAETQGHYWASLRFQYVNFPARWSPYWRLFAGAASIARQDSPRAWRGVGGAGLGLTTFLHDKIDLRLEARFVATDRLYGQGILAFNVKADRLLIYFAQKLRDIGLGTVETAIDAADAAIQATGEGIGGVVEGVSSPFRAPKPDEVSPAASPDSSPDSTSGQK